MPNARYLLIASSVCMMLMGCGAQPMISITELTGCVERQSAGAVTLDASGGDEISEAAKALGGQWGAVTLGFASGNDVAISVWPSVGRAREARDAYDRRYFNAIKAYPMSASMGAHFKVTDQFRNVVASYDHPPESSQRDLVGRCAR
jgi:hypothetical protein